jgi:hypothetical protein
MVIPAEFRSLGGTPNYGTRQRALEKVLGNEGFADALCAEPSLPSATLGKAFAECFKALPSASGTRQSRRFR